MPNSLHLPSPWPRDEWMGRFTGRIPGSVFDLHPLLAPHIVDFIARNA
jgi:hypothetical protein